MPTTQQGLRQQSVRDVTGTTYTYDGDWNALFDDAGIPQGTTDGRLLTWINDRLSASYTNLPSAMQAFAEDQGYFNWSSMGTFDAGGGGGGPFLLLADGTSFLLLADGSSKLILPA